jgi:hypothetical protein
MNENLVRPSAQSGDWRQVLVDGQCILSHML